MADGLQPIPMWNLPRYMGPRTPPFVPPSQPGANAPEWLKKVQGGLGRVLGTNQPNPYLSGPEQEALNRQRQMAMAAAFLQSGRPVPKGTGSPLAGIGDAIQAGQTVNQQATADAMRARIMAAQLAQANQGRAEPAAIREMQAMGLDPRSEQDRATYAQWKSSASPPDPNAVEISNLRREILAQQAAEGARTAEEATRTAAETSAARRTTINRGIEQTEKIAGLVENLEGTFLQTGVPASEYRRALAGGWAGVKEFFGGDTSKERKALDSFDELKKNMSDQLINLMESGALGQGTNAKLQQYQNALASPETSPGAILEIQANITRDLLDAADNSGIEVPNRAEVEARIQQMREYTSPAGNTVIDVPAILQMTRDQLTTLDPSQMTREQLEAARKRFDEIGQ